MLASERPPERLALSLTVLAPRERAVAEAGSAAGESGTGVERPAGQRPARYVIESDWVLRVATSADNAMVAGQAVAWSGGATSSVLAAPGMMTLGGAGVPAAEYFPAMRRQLDESEVREVWAMVKSLGVPDDEVRVSSTRVTAAGPARIVGEGAAESTSVSEPTYVLEYRFGSDFGVVERVSDPRLEELAAKLAELGWVR
jgi:hypothetical protein